MGKTYDIQAIMDFLPHRYPFILVDRILDLVPGEKITALKNVTINEPFFQGHFPGQPIFPGVLILEGMAQTGGCMAFCSVPAYLLFTTTKAISIIHASVQYAVTRY